MAGTALDEFARIRHFFAPLSGPGGLGLADDAAIVACDAGERLVVTTDAIVEGVHYLAADAPDLVAKKLLRVNLSDLAAMAARPAHYLLTTALPAAIGEEWLAGFARGLADDQQEFGVDLVGGDSVRTRGPTVLSVTAIGKLAAGTEVRRSGARPDDTVWVSGTIGDAALGLEVLRGGHRQLVAAHREALASRFHLPLPRTGLGPELAAIAHAMIDVSDGLLADLGHICEASRVAAVIDLTALPLSPAAQAVAAGDPAIRQRLAAGGDDYELLFTTAAQMAGTVADLSRRLGLPVTPIGGIEPGAGIRVVGADGRVAAVEAAGFKHF